MQEIMYYKTDHIVVAQNFFLELSTSPWQTKS